jgi:hypothetical protein
VQKRLDRFFSPAQKPVDWAFGIELSSDADGTEIAKQLVNTLKVMLKIFSSTKGTDAMDYVLDGDVFDRPHSINHVFIPTRRFPDVSG